MSKARVILRVEKGFDSLGLPLTMLYLLRPNFLMKLEQVLWILWNLTKFILRVCAAFLLLITWLLLTVLDFFSRIKAWILRNISPPTSFSTLIKPQKQRLILETAVQAPRVRVIVIWTSSLTTFLTILLILIRSYLRDTIEFLLNSMIACLVT